MGDENKNQFIFIALPVKVWKSVKKRADLFTLKCFKSQPTKVSDEREKKEKLKLKTILFVEKGTNSTKEIITKILYEFHCWENYLLCYSEFSEKVASLLLLR